VFRELHATAVPPPSAKGEGETEPALARAIANARTCVSYARETVRMTLEEPNG
jgi:hypothetical protein